MILIGQPQCLDYIRVNIKSWLLLVEVVSPNMENGMTECCGGCGLFIASNVSVSVHLQSYPSVF